MQNPQMVNTQPLNPQATPFIPRDQRSLYLTFSNGLPLMAWEIYQYFNSWIPGIVERVEVPQPSGGGPPLYGWVVFRNAYIPDRMMRCGNRSSFTINGRPVYCRRFAPRTNTTTDTAASTSNNAGENHSGGEE